MYLESFINLLQDIFVRQDYKYIYYNTEQKEVGGEYQDKAVFIEILSDNTNYYGDNVLNKNININIELYDKHDDVYSVTQKFKEILSNRPLYSDMKIESCETTYEREASERRIYKSITSINLKIIEYREESNYNYDYNCPNYISLYKQYNYKYNKHLTKEEVNNVK